MIEADLRKLALELAVASRNENDRTPADVLARAEAYYNYLKGNRSNG